MATQTNTIFYDRYKGPRSAASIQTNYEAIKAANKELSSTIVDMKDFWKGTLATKFYTQIAEYCELIDSYCKCLQDGSENLEKGCKAYSEFDESFANKTL